MRRGSRQVHRPRSDGFRATIASERSDRFQVQAPMRRSSIRRIVLGLTSALALSWPAGVSAAPGPDPYARCRERFAQQPDDYESAYCFYQVTIDERRWDEGARVFDDLIAAHPGNLWLPLAYGHVYRTRDPNRAERLYRRPPTVSGRPREPKANCSRAAISGTSCFRSVASTRPRERWSALSRSATHPTDPIAEGAGVEPGGPAYL